MTGRPERRRPSCSVLEQKNMIDKTLFVAEALIELFSRHGHPDKCENDAIQSATAAGVVTSPCPFTYLKPFVNKKFYFFSKRSIMKSL